MSPQPPKAVPTLFEWMGGLPARRRLMATFYARVVDDPVLGPVFSKMGPEHVEHVTLFIAEVLGGPKSYSADLGGHPAMIRRHAGRNLSEEQRQRWLQMLLQSADDCGIPDDPEFRSAFVSYLEWGTRLAVINSKPGAPIAEKAPMPLWDWGVVKGPYIK
ncbi:MAG: group II truncated hemoglobin [Myxococcales bacterium]